MRWGRGASRSRRRPPAVTRSRTGCPMAPAEHLLHHLSLACNRSANSGLGSRSSTVSQGSSSAPGVGGGQRLAQEPALRRDLRDDVAARPPAAPRGRPELPARRPAAGDGWGRPSRPRPERASAGRGRIRRRRRSARARLAAGATGSVRLATGHRRRRGPAAPPSTCARSTIRSSIVHRSSSVSTIEPRVGAPPDRGLVVGQQPKHPQHIARLEPVAVALERLRAWPRSSPRARSPSWSMSSARSTSAAPPMNSARSAPASTSRSTSGKTPAGRRSADQRAAPRRTARRPPGRAPRAPARR